MDIAYCRWIIDKHMESGYFTMEIFHSDINYVNVLVSIIMCRLSAQVFFCNFVCPNYHVAISSIYYFRSNTNFSILYEFWHKTKPGSCITIIALSLHLYIHGNIEELLDWMLMMIHRTKQKVYK